MGDGRAEGSSAAGEGGQAAMSLTPDIGGTHICIFESSQGEGSYVGDSLYINITQKLRLAEGVFSAGAVPSCTQSLI